MKPLSKVLATVVAAAGLAAAAALPAMAQSAPPSTPNLTSAQSADVERQFGLYRSEIDGRVSRGEVTADEANRLLQWRRWQLTQQVAGLAPPAATYNQVPPVAREESYVPYYSAPYYAPAPYYYAPTPYYYGPSSYYYGPRICAGGWGRHVGGRICL